MGVLCEATQELWQDEEGGRCDQSSHPCPTLRRRRTRLEVAMDDVQAVNVGEACRPKHQHEAGNASPHSVIISQPH